ncbi:MAG TPA: hypothetical protein VHD56_14085 [Tepidisphaeraceae bacterium]|nr:hypothetical protein [Tepidisphaeraceae bacterium]
MRKLILLVTITILFGLFSTAFGHVEAVEISSEIVAYPDHATMEVRVPIRELIQSEQPPDVQEPPNFDQEPNAVAKKHGDEVARAFHVSYDATALQAKLSSILIRQIVIGVSEDDVAPRACAIYTMEFTSPQSIAPPKRVVMTQDLFRLPPDAGFEQTVLCAINFRQSYETAFRSILLGHDENLTVQTEWPTVASQASASANIPASPVVTSSGGPLLVAVIAGIILIGLVVVIFRQRA